MTYAQFLADKSSRDSRPLLTQKRDIMFHVITRILALAALLTLLLVFMPPSALAGCRYLSQGIQICCQRLDSGKVRCCYLFTVTGRVVCMRPR